MGIAGTGASRAASHSISPFRFVSGDSGGYHDRTPLRTRVCARCARAQVPLTIDRCM